MALYGVDEREVSLAIEEGEKQVLPENCALFLELMINSNTH